MRGALIAFALLGCEAPAQVIFPDAGAAVARIDVTARPDVAADVSLGFDLAPDRTLAVDVAPFDPDGGVAPACGARARLEDPAGDYIVVGNPSGGRFVVEVDTPVRAVGVIAAGPLTLLLTGARVSAVQRVVVVGAEAVAASVSGIEAGLVDRITNAPAPLSDADGVATMVCAAGCDPLRPPREFGCNTRAQIEAYFTARLGEGRRWALLQREGLDGLRVRTSAGGCCL